MNEMTPQECAERLKNIIVSLDYNPCLNELGIKALNQSATVMRKLAAGELVEVVKCGECKHCEKNPYTKMRFCTARPNPNYVSITDFCSYGKRKDDAK